MQPGTIRFASLLLTGLAMTPAVAHLMELPNKINLPAQSYLTVQQIYRGWALLGLVIFPALLSLAILTAMVCSRPEFPLTLTALTAMACTQVIFWMFTYPANQATSNWTTLPADWMRLRTNWEYSHGAGAVLTLIAFVALAWSMTRGQRLAGVQNRRAPERRTLTR